jgi:NAD(P)-dependent dehydrogenase (short-subunit alcohol dehydrogenase family)
MIPVGVITGAGSGIGAAGAVEFARLGAHLTLASLPTPGLSATVDAVSRAGGVALAVKMDVRDFPEAVRRLIDSTVERQGRLDFLLANAGIADQELASEGDPDVWKRLIETNLLGAMYCVRFALAHMQRTSVNPRISPASGAWSALATRSARKSGATAYGSP